MSTAADTLRQRLIRATLWPALVVVSISGVFDYRGAVSLAQETQDSLLLKTALALATRMSPDEDQESREDIIRHFQPEDAAMMRADQNDVIHFLVLDSDGGVLVGDEQLIPLANALAVVPGENPVYVNSQVEGAAVRVIDFSRTVRGVTQRVLVSETNHKRSAATRQMVFNTLWPNLLLLIVMMILMQRGTRRALMPLDSLGKTIDRREAHDLKPIPASQVPGEIRPFVTAINGMLDRVAKTTAEQQIFLSGAAHQLRTPLAGIQAQLELASDEATPAIRDRLTRIHGAIDNLAHCTQQMLTLARSSAQASTALDYAPVDLPVLLEEAASTWLDMALRHAVELVFDIHPAHCRGSRWMIAEMLGNLIDNAIKHSPDGGHVTVLCGVDADHQPFVEVRDQGPGIPEDERGKVFEAFFRGAAGISTGSGLGLAIAREVANRHQATIAFLEPALQPGTRIRVTFPKMATD